MTTEIKKGKTTYSITKGNNDWLIYQKTIQKTNNHTSIKEDFSINTETHEVYCNRTGKQTFSIKRYFKLINRIGKIFNKSILEF